MCGIGGCVLPAGRTPSRERLERLRTALAHRGPDDSGIAIVGSVGLVHTRLAIVDPSPLGTQPMRHPSGDWWLSYNGEAYNHRQLRSELPRTDWLGGSDTETVLEAHASWGDAAIERLNGLFAYAVLDRRARRLLLVRDRFGVKPLYMARHDGGLWFASESQALLAAGLPRQARTELLAEAVELGWASGPATPLAGIERVRPGTAVSVDVDTLATDELRWYDPAEAVDLERLEELRGRSRAQLAKEVEELLGAAVRRRLMADVPVGTMCSGGLDSGLVTAFAAEAHPGITAFNAAIVDQPHLDETRWASDVASHLGVDLHTVPTTAEDWRSGLVEAVRHNGYPLNHASAVPMARIAGAAEDAGIKVLLAGEGADELFGGYPWHHRPERVRFAARRRPLAGLLRRLRARAASPEPSSPEPVVARARAAYADQDAARAPLSAGFLADLSLYLPHLLNRDDKMTMMRSVEARMPFLDPELVAFAINLPLEARVEPDVKGVLRDIGRARLAPGVADRDKVGFELEPAAMLSGRVRAEFLEGGMLRDVLRLDATGWQRLLDRRGPLSLGVWTAEVWCRLNLDAQPVEVVEDALWTDPDGDQ